MVSQTSKKTGRPYSTPEKTRQEMWELWLKGYTYMELAEKYEMYRQKTRTIILGFSPALEDFKKHDENRRIREAAQKLNS
jgi:hypothetical protein